MSEKQLKSRHGTRYSFSVVLTTFFLSLSGTFQLGFQDIFYEHYNKAFNPEINEEMYYFPTEEKMVHDTNATRGFNTTTIKPKNFENFSPRVSHTLLYFHLGAAIGSLLFGSIFLKLGAKWSFLLFSGLGILTSPLIALGEIIQNHFLLLLIIRSFYGICIGFLTCLQIFVLNDIAFDEDRNVFNFFIVLGIPLGAFAGLFAGYEPFTDAEIWYGGHLFSILPLLISFIYGLLFFRDPLSTLILKGNDEKAIKSAKHYYGDFRAGFALAETYDRIKIRPSVPTPITIWSDKIALKALFLSVLVNFIAGFSGDRFSWIFLYRYLTATNRKYEIEITLLLFLTVMTFVGAMFSFTFFNKFERKHLLIGTAALASITELLFGFFWQFVAIMDIGDRSYRCLIGAMLRTIQNSFLIIGLNSVALFVSTDLAFSGNKSILLSISFTVRAITTAFHPLIIGHLYDLSPLASSILTVIPLIGFSIFVGLRFPRLQSLTPYQILQSFGYTLNLEATFDEIQYVRKNMNKLWQNPKES